MVTAKSTPAILTCPTCGQATPPLAGIHADLDRNVVVIDGIAIKMQPSNVEIVSILIDKGGVVRYGDLHTRLYGNSIDGGPQLRTLKVHVSAIRKHLAGTRATIKTYGCRGYALELEGVGDGAV